MASKNASTYASDIVYRYPFDSILSAMTEKTGFDGNKITALVISSTTTANKQNRAENWDYPP